jgi:glucokinase
VVDDAGEILQTARRPTPAEDPDGVVRAVVEGVEELRAAHEVEAIGVGAAGWISSDRSTVMLAPNLTWRDEPLRDKVSAATGLPVVVENDANVAMWGEFQYGAAKGARTAVLFTVGTGIGGGIVVKGELLRGQHGVAAEIGHIMAVPGGRECGCGRRGCLEQYASGRALTRAGQEGAKTDPDRAPVLLKLAGGDPDAITGREITEAAKQGDEVALEAFDFIGHHLAEACVDMVQLFDPNVILIGGGVVDAGELLLEPIRRHYERDLADRAKIPVAEIKAAVLGSEAGIIGAADLARI